MIGGKGGATGRAIFKSSDKIPDMKGLAEIYPREGAEGGVVFIARAVDLRRRHSVLPA